MKTSSSFSAKSLLITFGLAVASATGVRAEIIADSVAEFNGNQGMNGWYNGYRNVTSDGAGASYDPLLHFIQFAGGEGMGAWNGTSQLWTGSAWDLNTASAAPWTFLANTNSHPNGTNSAGGLHWVIRRWFADELIDITPLKITWHLRKQSFGGNGVTGGIYTNGVRADSATIGGSDGVGVTRTYYINAEFGYNIDLILSPVGTDGLPTDASDGSFNWMTVDTTIPERPEQPDGTIFIPHGSPDTDGDGLPDIWENAYAPGDLTRFNATSDDDGDGSNETQEFERGTSPIDSDTDNDGLSDGVESGTGNYVSPADTGTQPRQVDTDGDGRTDGEEVIGPPTSNPTLVDTDGDGFSDGAEVNTGHNPNDPGHNQNTTPIADSRAGFSGTQGSNQWFYGYRNFSADGAGVLAYNPSNHFIQFAGGEGLGAWDGTNQFWAGTQWDLNTAGAAPWTELGRENVHPNGNNSTPPPVHWCVRRWVASEITSPTPYTFRWNVRKSNLNGSTGNGVTGGIYINGRRADTATINFNDGVGPTRTYYANINPNDVIDLILSPRGPNGTDNDGADGSLHWMTVDPTMPPIPRQPDGTLFIPVNSPDSDTDTLPDVWERFYFSNRLDVVTGTTDFDGDGLNEGGEFQRDSNPTRTDTDSDGLSDAAETKTGIYVSPTDTGTDPKVADSDGDGLSDSAEVNGNPATNPNRVDTDGDTFSDSAELAAFSDPNNAADTPRTFVIADSILEFSGNQGQNDWFNGYRNVTVDGAGFVNYDAVTHFIPYAGGPAAGAWNGTSQMWTGSAWDLNTAAAGPWTFQNAMSIHPNGTNSAPLQEHWAIRRWVANELTNETPVAIVWRVAKESSGGTGVSGSLHRNGTRIDFKSIAGTDTTNAQRRFYTNLSPGDIVDLAHTPEGNTGNRTDGSDGSILWFIVDARIPANPIQPDGAPFTGHLPRVLDIDYNDGGGTVTLLWRSRPGRTYTVQAAPDITGPWDTIVSSHASAGDRTSYTETLPNPRPARRFYRISQE